MQRIADMGIRYSSSALIAAVASFGLGALVIGLAAENIVNDVLSGIVISIDRPFWVGDRIEIRELETLILEAMTEQEWVMRDRPVQVLDRGLCGYQDLGGPAQHGDLHEALCGGVIAGPSSDIIVHRAPEEGGE